MFSLHTFVPSGVIRIIIIVLAIIAVVLLVFGTGMLVGYKNGTFICHVSDNYLRIFGDEQKERMNGFVPAPLPGGHGAIGTIVRIQLPSITVADDHNVEKSVVITDDTLIRRMKGTALPTDLVVGDSVVVLGTPGSEGEIDARLIRILPPRPSGLSAPAPLSIPTDTPVTP
jgi:hypothetical protein